MVIKLERITDKTLVDTPHFKWSTPDDVGVIQTKEQMVSIWLDKLGVNLSMALFLKSLDKKIYPISAITVDAQKANLWTLLQQWIEVYSISSAVVSPIEGAPEELNKDIKLHPVCRELQQRYGGWRIRIAKPWVPFMALTELNRLKREDGLSLDFFESGAKLQELLDRRKVDDGIVMAYLQGFVPYDDPVARLTAMYGN